jgi:RNA polymerase sporulation-specific sigma factor
MLLRANKKYKQDISLNDSVGSDKDGNELTLMDVLCEKEDSVFRSVDRAIENEKLMAFMERTLDKREFRIMCLRYGLRGGKAYAQREVATFLKISRSYISRIEKRAIEKLKEAVKKEHFYC